MSTPEEYELILSAISHEIRNPVALINSYLQLMASAHPEVQDYDQWQPVQGEMDYLKELLTEISAYHNSSHLQMTAVDLNLWFAEYERRTAALVDSLWAAKTRPAAGKPFFHVERPAKLPVIYMDPVKLRQVLDNLLRNSVEATGSHLNEITLSVRTTSTLEIRLSDTGCGIAPEHLDTLFQPFISHKPGGTGLGLSMATRIVRAHGGTLTVTSTPGLGTEMVISLPLG